MKTLSVKQVADVLGVSPRAILKRLSNGQLKGTRRTNKYGVEEWWVYPNKEIRESLEASGKSDLLGETGTSDLEVVDVETQICAPDDDVIEDDEGKGSAWSDARQATSGMAEELWNSIISRFLDELKDRDQLIGEMRMELAEKERELRLLPDLQKQAEAERQEAELRALEVEALKKQVGALAEQKEQLESKANEAVTLASELHALKSQVEELQKPWWKRWFSAAE